MLCPNCYLESTLLFNKRTKNFMEEQINLFIHLYIPIIVMNNAFLKKEIFAFSFINYGL